MHELNNIRKEIKKQFLYQLWCFKESYIKYLGLALSMSLFTFYIKSSGGKYEVRNNRGKIDCKIESLNIDRSSV
ncbi:4'-phosphopantetheinyl transferase family protein [Enterococcus sp. 4G2_DIV0659]|uniref:4'-phosphopantetheinyl transferase family protein n=1 Tax=Candidatus Enterococcus mansonii TaxID=1834181 RepID=UPI000A3411C5